MNIHVLTKLLYGVLGIFFTGLGLILIFTKSGIFPAFIEKQVFHAAGNNMYSLHVLQEFGSLMIFAGILSFWYIRDYKNSTGFHWAVTVFWIIMSAVHWVDAVSEGAPIIYPLINTMPMLLFLATGMLARNRH